MPAVFTQLVQNKKNIACSTAKLTSLSDRATEAIKTALALTHELLQVTPCIIILTKGTHTFPYYEPS